ncbi:MAG: DUF1569 domain-containing protein [Saprospiraceae bacterium]|nr:DUF1569 domain-containing protein [Saprospiraceae bacterium]
MAYPNLFDKAACQLAIARISQLTPETKPQWGKMTVDQMLAHVNVAYELVHTNKHPKPGWFARFIAKTFAKEIVVGPKPYKKNTRTAPMFLQTGPKDFAAEKERLIEYINKTQELGADHFDQKESHSFGMLTITEWNTLFSKHIDHHLRQFGV